MRNARARHMPPILPSILAIPFLTLSAAAGSHHGGSGGGGGGSGGGKTGPLGAVSAGLGRATGSGGSSGGSNDSAGSRTSDREPLRCYDSVGRRLLCPVAGSLIVIRRAPPPDYTGDRARVDFYAGAQK